MFLATPIVLPLVPSSSLVPSLVLFVSVTIAASASLPRGESLVEGGHKSRFRFGKRIDKRRLFIILLLCLKHTIPLLHILLTSLLGPIAIGVALTSLSLPTFSCSASTSSAIPSPCALDSWLLIGLLIVPSRATTTTSSIIVPPSASTTTSSSSSSASAIPCILLSVDSSGESLHFAALLLLVLL